MFGDYTLAEAARELGCSEWMVERLLESGTLVRRRRYWLFGEYLVRAREIEQFGPTSRRVNALASQLYRPYLLATPEEVERLKAETAELERRNAETEAELERRNAETEAELRRVKAEGREQLAQEQEKLRQILSQPPWMPEWLRPRPPDA
jgi:hypothetical protein